MIEKSACADGFESICDDGGIVGSGASDSRFNIKACRYAVAVEYGCLPAEEDERA